MFRVLIIVSLTSCCFAGLVQRPMPDGRIVGGKDAKIEDFPYQLSLRQIGSHACGASIIGPNTVVTAAHCVVGFSGTTINPAYVTFRAGSANQYSGGTIHQAVNIIAHPKYNPHTVDYDIAVVQVREPFPIASKTVDSIKLAEKEASAGKLAVVTGWGHLQSGGSSPDILQQVEVPIVSRKICDNAYAYNGGITERMICAGYDQGGKDACQNDSGGPLVVDNTLVGIVSWGRGCAKPGYPGVYTNVADLRAWVKENTGI